MIISTQARTRRGTYGDLGCNCVDTLQGYGDAANEVAAGATSLTSFALGHQVLTSVIAGVSVFVLTRILDHFLPAPKRR